MPPVKLGPFDFGRIVNAAEKVRQRLLKAAAILDTEGIPYAVIGGNAVANWVSRIDESLVRFTRDVDLLMRREDLPRARTAFEREGFVYRHSAGMDMFLDGPTSRAGDAVHVLFAGERVRADDAASIPAIEEVDPDSPTEFRVLTLEALVRMKLVAYRIKDKTHLMDIIGVGLIDASWPAKYPEPLASRLQELLDNPDG